MDVVIETQKFGNVSQEGPGSPPTHAASPLFTLSTGKIRWWFHALNFIRLSSGPSTFVRPATPTTDCHKPLSTVTSPCRSSQTPADLHKPLSTVTYLCRPSHIPADRHKPLPTITNPVNRPQSQVTYLLLPLHLFHRTWHDNSFLSSPVLLPVTLSPLPLPALLSPSLLAYNQSKPPLTHLPPSLPLSHALPLRKMRCTYKVCFYFFSCSSTLFNIALSLSLSLFNSNTIQ